MKGITKYLLLFLFIPLFFFPKKSQATDNHLLINEIYPSPFSGGKEWVEIYNPTASEIDLSEYYLRDGASNAKNLSGAIFAGGYFVFEISSGWLNNSGDELLLIFKPTTAIVDQVVYGNWDDGNIADNAVKPATGESISRIPNGVDSDSDIDDFRIVPTTPGLENLLSLPIIYSDKIIINELSPQPATASSDEFIELYNFGDLDVDLSGWRLDDSSPGSEYLIPEGTIIGAKKYLVFCKDSKQSYCDFNRTMIALNDTSSDYLILLDPNGDLKSQTPSYEKAKRGYSFAKFIDDWLWTTTPTPGAANTLTVETEILDNDLPIIETDITTARTLPDGEIVAVVGVVSVAPEKLSSQYFYIQDATSGIQIYSYHKSFPHLSPGNEVKICGQLATISGERRIKIAALSDVVLINTRPPPEPQKMTVADLGEPSEGRYVVVTGEVTKTSGDTFYIRGSGEIQVIIRQGTEIKKPTMRVGDKIQVAGILSQYNDHYRILPTKQDDVKILQSSVLVSSGPNLSFVLIVFGLLIFFITYGISLRERKRYGGDCCQNYKEIPENQNLWS